MIIYYFLGTTLGHANVGYLLEGYYSKLLGNKIEILSLNIANYPIIIAEMKINDTARFSLKGNADTKNIDMQYHLRGERFTWNNHDDILHPINLKGSMKGKLSELLVKGEGEIFYGKMSYSFIRKEHQVEALEVAFNDISSKDLLTFLKYDLAIEGEVDLFLHFDYFSAFRKKGLAKIAMKKAKLPKILEEVDFILNGEIVYTDLLRDFFVDIHSDIGKLNITKGFYNKSAELIQAEYTLQINELSDFEEFLGHPYQGKLNTEGNAKYELEKLSLLGETATYGGILGYNYQNNYLKLDFNGVSLEELLRQLSFPALLSSKVYGIASYDMKDDIIFVDTKLKETRFRRTKMTDTFYDLTDIDILKDVYDNSMFTAGYQDAILTSFLQIDNGINHLYLPDTKMDAKTNGIKADFEMFIDGEEFVGEIEGTLEDPEVNLDMSKLIKYQINKQMDEFFGTGKSSGKKSTGSFLDGFFD